MSSRISAPTPACASASADAWMPWQSSCDSSRSAPMSPDSKQFGGSELSTDADADTDTDTDTGAGADADADHRSDKDKDNADADADADADDDDFFRTSSPSSPRPCVWPR